MLLMDETVREPMQIRDYDMFAYSNTSDFLAAMDTEERLSQESEWAEVQGWTRIKIEALARGLFGAGVGFCGGFLSAMFGGGLLNRMGLPLPKSKTLVWVWVISGAVGAVGYGLKVGYSFYSNKNLDELVGIRAEKLNSKIRIISNHLQTEINPDVRKRLLEIKKGFQNTVRKYIEYEEGRVRIAKKTFTYNGPSYQLGTETVRTSNYYGSPTTQTRLTYLPTGPTQTVHGIFDCFGLSNHRGPTTVED